MSIQNLPQRNHYDVMSELVPLAGKVALEIGCGEGRFTRLMAGGGAQVTGIDSGPHQIKRALAQPRVAGETYSVGTAEALDIKDGSVDVVAIFNSLHHFSAMDKALAEAARVLRPGGLLYIAEPIAEGPGFELAQPFNDETEVRALAQEAIGRASAYGLTPQTETRYLADGKHASFEAYRDNSIAIDPDRAKFFAAKEDEIRSRFHALGEKKADGWHFVQPLRVNLLRKA